MLSSTAVADATDQFHKDQSSSTDKLSTEFKIQRMAVVIQRAFRLYLWKRFIHKLSIERKYSILLLSYRIQFILLKNIHIKYLIIFYLQ